MSLVLRKFDTSASLLALSYRDIVVSRPIGLYGTAILPEIVSNKGKRSLDETATSRTFVDVQLTDGEYTCQERKAAIIRIEDSSPRFLADGTLKKGALLSEKILKQSKEFSHIVIYVGSRITEGIQIVNQVGLHRCTIVYCGCIINARKHWNEADKADLEKAFMNSESMIGDHTFSYVIGDCSGISSMGQFISDFLTQGRTATLECNVRDMRNFFEFPE